MGQSSPKLTLKGINRLIKILSQVPTFLDAVLLAYLYWLTLILALLPVGTLKGRSKYQNLIIILPLKLYLRLYIKPSCLQSRKLDRQN